MKLWPYQLEFHDDPGRVRAGERLVMALDRLVDRLDGALALVSGRTLAALEEVFGPASYRAAGLHGLEWTGDERPQGKNQAITRTVADARAALAAYPGAFVESKGAAVALHWRAERAAAPVALEFAARTLPTLPGYRLEPGKDVVELRPSGADKGTAIRRFMASTPFAGRRPVFAGDDLTDEAGFRTVNAIGGITIRVGARAPTEAKFGLADPAAVLEWLEVAP